ncbi:ABC transporter ATP-binding protein [Sediminibacillus halophilus]|uniref:ABC-2 type transport system ATP-binding protein n=1 Tax=Sediminibacillus halophilus TaxID=482461 RepID=A0A1G9NX18_9BACI|nr:ABC transporter ATP-binding protein [Sediminibacillus halophilus]SDL91128.1 ABC-2 type transport system ATP-binding protein [Sediminibacillus halophilus]
MIVSNSISKKYEKSHVLQHVGLQVRKGSIYGLLGSNGAGKTTLMKIIAGIARPDDGEITIDGKGVFEDTEVKAKMFFLSDSLYFFSQYTIKQMADFFRDTYPNWNQERFFKLQQLFQLDMKKKISQFSKGMQRQVAFWLALSTMPEYLILDEPFDGLDAVIRKKIKNLLVQDVAEREMTIIISSHNLREIEDICDYIGILHQGKLLLEKDIDDLKSDIHKVQVAFREKPDTEVWDGLDILYKEKRGSVILAIVRGKEERIVSHLEQFHPVILDLLPLTLEEIFVYEMGDAGYAIENILV